jgi:diaminopimelate decarboxylase
LSTPCFILREPVLRDNLAALQQGFVAGWPNLIVGYSYKTNALPWLLAWLKERGVWAEVVSTPEYELAQHLGYDASAIILNGPNKGYTTLRTALDAGAMVNLDHFQEIEWLLHNAPPDKTWKVGLRLNLPIEKDFPDASITGAEPGRFGFSVENGDFEQAVQQLQKAGIVVNGLHTHHSTRTKSAEIFAYLAKKAGQCAANIAGTLEYVDIGGGFYGDKPGAPTYAEYGAAIGAALSRYFSPDCTALVVEPGVALAASCFSYRCTVTDVRTRGGCTFITTDGSAMQIDPQMSGRRFPVQVLRQNPTAEGPVCPEQIICGYTCMERDRFARLRDLPALQPGDQLHFALTGAYTLAFTPLFIEYFPPVYLENVAGELSCIREKWGVREFLGG